MDFLIIIIALILSAFFSGMEIAYIASNRLRIELDRKQSRPYAYIMGVFLRHPGQYISTMLVGNNTALVIYSLFMSGAIQLYVSRNILLETLISTLIIIFTAEFLPKAAVKISPNWYLKIFAIPAYIFYVLFYPVARFATLLSIWILKLLGLKTNKPNQAETFGKLDLQTLVDESTDNDGCSVNGDAEKDLQLFQNALDFSELKVRECMVPRVEIEAVDVDHTAVSELLDVFKQTHFSRIPLYQGTIDNIVGYASSRGLFNRPGTVREMLREILYVPESGSIQKLLSDFIKGHKSMAVVIDEFGSTAGVITIEDILEQIVGEIEDEHDREYMVERELAPGKWLFSARQEIEYLNETYNLHIPESEDYETLAGYVLYHSEDLPLAGDTIQIDDLTCKIERATSNKISLIEVTKTPS